MTRSLFIFMLLTLASCVRASNTPADTLKPFEFWVSDLNKAAGERITYHLTSDSIEIKSGPYDFIYFSTNYKKDVVKYKFKLNPEQREKMNTLGKALEYGSLKSQYTNLCIIDGMILTFRFESGDKEMVTTLSNYYLSELSPFIEFINSLAPKEYHIGYDKVWLEKVRKDCPDDRILD